MSEIGPVSQAMLDYIDRRFGYIEIFRMIDEVARVTGIWHGNPWYFRRLLALGLEGRIEVKVIRKGDELSFRFRRLQEAEGE